MLINVTMTTAEIEEWISTLPEDDEFHPLPLPTGFSPDRAEWMKLTLIDLGQGSLYVFDHLLITLTALMVAQWTNQPPTVDTFSAFSLRAPEVILASDFGPSVDIWAIGCLVSMLSDIKQLQSDVSFY